LLRIFACSDADEELHEDPVELLLPMPLIYRLVEADDGSDLHGETGSALSGR